MFPDDAITVDGDLVHSAPFVDVEPVSFEQAIREPKWLAPMEDVLRVILKNLP